MKFTIVSAFTNNDAQVENLDSVNRLVVPDGVTLDHVIFVDGADFTESANISTTQIPARSHVKRYVVNLPFNTGGPRDGKPGYLCHLINAASSFFIDTDWISFLDEDNLLEPNHLVEIVRSIREKPDAVWGFTLRKVFMNTQIVADTVESMGNIRHTKCGESDFLVDTNCFFMRSETARLVAPIWNTKARSGKLEADRHLFRVLAAEFPDCARTRAHTVKYRLGNRSDSVQMDFFTTSTLPEWSREKKDLYVFFFNNSQTQKVLKPGKKDPLGEWCMTLLEKFETFGMNLINGYSSLLSNTLPTDATCFLVMCDPNHLPLQQLYEKKQSTHRDMTRILYTAEGPNIRHRAQWTKQFLTQFFDKIMTYADFVLDDPDIPSVFCPHNARFLSDTAEFVQNEGKNNGNAVMVLEPRPNTLQYTIDGFPNSFTCLDGLRVDAATGLKDLTVHGRGWKTVTDQMTEDGLDPPKLGGNFGKFDDEKSVISIYKNHDFAVIIENTDAPGYVSEKFMDSLVAGTIPIYYGKSLSKQHDDDILDGKGKFWIDIVDIINFCSDNGIQGALGSRISYYLEKHGYYEPTMIALMKKRICDIREKIVLARGSTRVASIVKSIVD